MDEGPGEQEEYKSSRDQNPRVEPEEELVNRVLRLHYEPTLFTTVRKGAGINAPHHPDTPPKELST